MRFAVYKGRAIAYNFINYGEVYLERVDGECMVIDSDIFTSLYNIMTPRYAALKTDMIEYCVWIRDKHIDDYPLWMKHAILDSFIFQIGGEWYFYSYNGEILMDQTAFILRNGEGELHYTTVQTFLSLYENIGGYYDEL